MLVKATLEDDKGKIMSGKRVEWSASSGLLSTSRTTTSQYGHAYVTFTAPLVENESLVEIRARFPGDERYLSSEASIWAMVYPLPKTTLITTVPKEFVLGAGENMAIIVILFDENHVRLGGKPITWFATRGTISGGAVTDENGMVSALYCAPSFVASTVEENIEVTFPGDWWHKETKAVATGKILPVSRASTLYGIIENLESSMMAMGMIPDSFKIFAVKQAYAGGTLGACFEVGAEGGKVSQWFVDPQIENFVVGLGKKKLAIWLGAENLTGRAVVFNVARPIFGDVGVENLELRLDGKQISKAESFEKVFEATRVPKYFMSESDLGFQVAVWIPEFSLHVISLRVVEPPSPIPSQATLVLFMVLISAMVFQRFVRSKVETVAERWVLERSKAEKPEEAG